MMIENLVRVFHDTMHTIIHSEALSRSVQQSFEQTEVYETYSQIQALPVGIQNKKGIVEVLSSTSFDAARHATGRIAVLNFANAFHPGGGVTRGARAQEECLCRCSTLYPCLKKVDEAGKYYAPHSLERRRQKSVVDQKGIIYTPGVQIMKTDAYKKLKQFVEVDVITAAAPEFFRMTNLGEDQLYQIFLEKIRAIVILAMYHQVDVLILGAFGCGAFRNPPELVARAFREVLEERVNGQTRREWFEDVVFAIRTSSGKESDNFKIFQTVLLKNEQ